MQSFSQWVQFGGNGDAVDNYVLFKLPASQTITFSNIGSGHFVDPFGSSITNELNALLPTKNDQLDVPGRLRSLLIVNAGIFPHEEYYVSRYFSITDLDRFPNIDRVFFEVTPEATSLIFDRPILVHYQNAELPKDEESLAFFMRFVEHRLSSEEHRAFGIIKQIRERFGNLDRLSSAGKDPLISCGERFVLQAKWDSVLWIIDELKNDVTASVRGRLCWLIQKVVVHNLIQHYPAMLDILERYTFGQDFYIRSEACVPLEEMSIRRKQLLPNGGRFMPEETAERVKRIALRALREAHGIPTLLDNLSNVFYPIRDLAEEHAAEVINRLSGVKSVDAIHNRCRLLLYFALFRETAFVDSQAFEATTFREQLHQDLRNGESKFRLSLMWLMAAGAENETYSYEAIAPYLGSMVSGPYDSACFLHLRRICRAYLKAHPATLCDTILAGLSALALRIMSTSPTNEWEMDPAREQMREFFDLLLNSCDRACMLKGVTLIMQNEATIRTIPRGKLLTSLEGHRSSAALELKVRLEAISA